MTIAVGQPPVADDDAGSMAEDAAATPINVLLNDSDLDLDTLTITAKTNGAKGVVTITGGGTGLTYKPNANANGADTFTYTIADGHGWTTIGTVNVTITPVQDPPNAVNDATLSVRESAGATALAVKANDSDPDGDTLTIVAKTNGAHGTVAITGGGTGLTYDPVNLYYGTDVFTYTLSDGHGGTDSATVLLTITKDTTKPVAIAPIESFYSQTVGTSSMKAHIAWSGTDTNGTGIGRYQLQVSTNGGSYVTREPGQRDLDLREPDPDGRPELPLPGACDRQAGQRRQLRLRADVQACSLPELELKHPLHGNLDDQLQQQRERREPTVLDLDRRTGQDHHEHARHRLARHPDHDQRVRAGVGRRRPGRDHQPAQLEDALSPARLLTSLHDARHAHVRGAAGRRRTDLPGRLPSLPLRQAP